MNNVKLEEDPQYKFLVEVLFSILYILIAFLSIKYTSYQFGHATIWPADALMLAAIFSRKINNINTVTAITFFSDLVVHVLCGYNNFFIIIYSSIHALQIFLSCHAYKKYIRKGVIFSSDRSILLFNLSSGVVFPFLCALLGTAVNAIQFGSSSLINFAGWFFSLSLGNVIFARPFTYVLTGALRDKFKSDLSKESNIIMFSCSVLITLYLSFLVFNQNMYPFLFIPSALVIVNSLICGEVYGATSVMVISIMAIHFTFEDSGPIYLIKTGSLGHAVVLQIYLLFMVFTERAVSIVFMRNQNLVRSISAKDQMLDLVLSNATDCIVSVDRNGLCRWGGGACLELLGKSSSDIVGENIIEILGCVAVDNKKIREFLGDDHVGLNNFSFNSRCRHSLVLGVSFRKLVVDGTTAGAIVTIHDITMETEKVDEAVERAEKDQLTHLLNRSGFNKKIKKVMSSRDAVFCIAYIDIDHFKLINDTYGHDVGDFMLAKLSNILLSQMRDVDIVSRFGGDEFVIAILSDKNVAKTVLERLVQKIRLETFKISETKEIKITISCGFSSRISGEDVNLLLQEADSALYIAKRTGRDRVCEFSHEPIDAPTA